MDFLNLIGVQFRTAGRIYSFNGGSLILRKGEQVVVDTERGPSLGTVVRIGFVPTKKVGGRQLKSIVRVAGPKDLQTSEKLTADYVENFVKDLIRRLSLNMKILKAEVQFSGNKVLIYFTAPGRVDFRELVKQLASGLRSRVELKQVGARDEAKLIGGLGVCGREFCCSTFLREFVPVSIKMAKNQNLALNPKKVSGGCGRLLCCLTYEDEYYQSIKVKMPPRGSRVRVLSTAVIGDIIKVDLLNQRVVLELADGTQEPAAVNDIEVIARGQETDEDVDTWGDELDPNLFEEDSSRSGLDEDETGNVAKSPRDMSAKRSHSPTGRAPEANQPRARRPEDSGKEARRPRPHAPRGSSADHQQEGSRDPSPRRGEPRPPSAGTPTVRPASPERADQGAPDQRQPSSGGGSRPEGSGRGRNRRRRRNHGRGTQSGGSQGNGGGDGSVN